ncbi:uncharacterized protein H6S33_011552 [Morchella sextelata]|uniref:uncharacterized protein n=1 Tax=Morchella sextelata TaxID=1174677 RepID=UPI001D044472|nr:uncharacterized protein H6S33_011552 [Morchella sextelata]KAH0611125.1 hypothetical protein H6S33_011552 [Morchella sextelata]
MATPTPPTLIRLQPLLDTLRQQHTQLRAQNDKLVRVGVAMEGTLRPVEGGMRTEREKRAAEEAAGRTKYGGGRGAGEEGRGEEGVRGVGGK